MTEKEWVRLGGKDGVYLVEGEDYTVDRKAGLLTINEKAWAKVPARCIKDMDVQVDVGVYPGEEREAKEMIPILEFSSAEHRDIRPGYPEPGIFHPEWYCSICGKLVPAGHSACHMHEVDRYISGTFCATSGANIPDHADEIKFVIDSLIITLKCVVIRPSPNTNGNKIVPSAPIDAQCKRVYYTFDASSIEYDTGEERGKNDEEMPI